jgi:hypothetical protein
MQRVRVAKGHRPLIDLMDSFPTSRYRAVYEGLVKFKLVHTVGQSIFAPDLVVLNEADRWIWLSLIHSDHRCSVSMKMMHTHSST